MTPTITASKSSPDRSSIKGLRQFLDAEQQRRWMEGEANPPEQPHGRHAGVHGGTAADERSESLEQRFKYAARFEKLLRRPQAQEVLEILRLYGQSCIPIPRTTERRYWSVSCLPSTSDKPLARVNASWMELFTLLPEGDGPSAPLRTGLRARFIVHLSDFTTDGSLLPEQLDEPFLEPFLEQCATRPVACPERSRRDVSHFFWKGDTFGINVRGSASIRAFLANPRALTAIRRFNLTHMNRGRNAYQASHCYSLADAMLD